MRLARAVARRFSWGLADQAMSSLSNAAVSLYIARQLGAAQFGAFSVAYVTYSFVLNASRGLATDPLLVRYSHVGHGAWKRAVQCCTTTAALVGLAMGIVCLIIGAVATGTTRLAFIALGLSLPGLTLQDSWRYSFFALGKGSKAFINDVIWAVSLIVALLLLRTVHHQTVFWFVLAWGTTASLAAVIGPLQARLIPRWNGAAEWLSKTRDLGARYLVENTGNSSSNQIRLYAVGLIAGLAAVGYIQEGILLMGPFSVIFMGVSLVTVPEAARSLRRSTKRLWRYCVLVAIGLTIAAFAWGVVLMVALPRGLGTLLLHKGSWESAYGVVPWMVMSMMGATAIAGASAGLRALGAARRSMRITLISSATYVLLGVIGAAVHGTYGSVEGTGVATWIGAALCWWQLRVALHEHSASLREGGAADGTVGAVGVPPPWTEPQVVNSAFKEELAAMSMIPRLSVGLPVYNSSAYVAQSIEAILGQTFDDFELIISDNASTDGTGDICREYASRDSRVRYFRQRRNIGLAPNHNFCVEQARGELFKWAAGDDLYARDLLEKCVAALDAHPEVVLAHSWTAMIDGKGTFFQANSYPLRTSSTWAPERFRSLLNDSGGDDDGGVMRKDVLLRTAMKESYHHADRTIIAELALYGRFYQVPEWLYFRRDHPDRAERAHPDVRARCANMDPRRGNAWLNPVPRLIAEYVGAYVRMIHRAPLTPAGRRECYQALAEWMTRRARSHHLMTSGSPAAWRQPAIDVTAMVAGRPAAG